MAALALTITPQPLTAAITSAISSIYGHPMPAFAGSLTGVLPQDAGNVSVSFSTTASTLSSAGTYPITASLGGSAAGNYTLAALTSTITIEPASTSTSLGGLAASAASGSALSITTQVSSTGVTTLAGTGHSSRRLHSRWQP